MLCARLPRSLAWPLLRLACGGLSLALIAGACSLDERTLSDAKLLDSTEHEDPIECGSTGETACATCLYAECCEQAQACDLGSSCSSYLECAGSCNSDQTCIDTCGTNY